MTTSPSGRPSAGRPAGPGRPVVDERLRGSAEILRHLPRAFPDRDLGMGTVVAILIDSQSLLVGHGRVRDLPPMLEDLPFVDRLRIVHSIVDYLLTADPRGTAGRACLLVAIRDGPVRVLDGDVGWWTALRGICGARGLVAADVLVSTPSGWFTLRAGTRGPAEWIA